MFPNTVELAFARFQARRDPRALAIVFDRTAGELMRVARHLASSEASAEDLVQATFVIAIEAAGEHRRGEPVLPWLLGILTNQARSARRRSRRQLDPTRLRREGLADASDEVERSELGAALQTAIARLPEVYRPVLRMWLELGLEAQEIAHALDRPAGTVRAQIARGLDQLRRALPHGITAGAAIAVATGRGIAAVRAAVLDACPGTKVGLASTLALGGLLVLHHKLLASGAVAALVLVAFGLPALLSSTPPAVPEATGTSPAAAVATIESPPAAVTADRVRATTADAAPAASLPAVSAGAATTGELVVEVVAAESGRPLAGIGLAVQRADDMNPSARRTEWIATDTAGVVRFAGLAPATWHIDVDRLGSIAAGIVVAGEVARRRVEIPGGIRVDGSVVDDGDRPVADAAIVVHGSRFAAPVVARSDALGHFAVEGLPPNLHLQAKKPGYAASPVLLVEGNPGASVAMALRLATGGRRISGRAIDEHGEPLSKATIAIVDADAVNVSFWDRSVPQRRPLFSSTGSDGTFATDEASRQRQLVLLQPMGGDLSPCWQFVEAGSNDAFVDLRATRAAVVAGRVVGGDPEGIVVQGASLDHAPLGFLVNLVGMRTVRIGVDGSYRLDGLPAGRVALTARRSFTTVAEGERVLGAGEAGAWDIDLRPGTAKVAFRVQVHADGPLPQGAMVMLWSSAVASSTPSMAALAANGTAVVERAGDAAVDVVVGVVEGRSLVQLARRTGVPPTEHGVEFTLTAAQLPRKKVMGRLVDAMGAPRANTSVVVMGADAEGLVVRIEATTDADGRFATAALPSGSYRICLADPMPAGPEIGNAVVTLDRDEDVGTMVLR